MVWFGGESTQITRQTEMPALAQMPATPPIDFWESVSKEIEEYQGKVERLGNVNLEAIKEQDELEIRETFLANQRDDLEKSTIPAGNYSKKLLTTSARISRQCSGNCLAGARPT